MFVTFDPSREPHYWFVVLIAALVFLLGTCTPAAGQNIDGISGETGVVVASPSADQVVVESFTFVLAEATGEAHFRFTNASDIHGREREKVAYRVNGGAWVSLREDNPQIQCDPFFDTIGGGKCFDALSTYQFIGPGNFQQGQNTLELRLTPNRFSGSAYLMRLRFPKGGNQYVEVLEPIPSTPLMEPEYAGGDVQRGIQVWTQPGTWAENHYVTDRKDRASCESCHFKNGADIYHWSIPARAFMARTLWHRPPDMSVAQAEQNARDMIAAMNAHGRVRNDDGTTLEKRVPVSNPVYQPGPGMSEGTSGEWLLGAGFDAVLHRTNDKGQWLQPTMKQMRDGIYPNGMDESEWYHATSPNDKLDNFEWNNPHRWWAQRHVLDLAQGGESSPDYQNWVRHIDDVYDAFEKGDKARQYAALQRLGGADATNLRNFKNGGSQNYQVGDGYGGDGFRFDFHQRMAVYSITWTFIRVIHETGGATLWKEFAPYKPKYAGFALTGASRAVDFDKGSHIVENKNQAHPYFCGTDAGFNWCSFLPYHRAVRLNPGVGNPGINATNPVDVGYLLMFAGHAKNPYISTSYLTEVARNLINCPDVDIDSNTKSTPGKGCAGIRQLIYPWYHWEIITDAFRFGGTETAMPDEDKARFMTFDLKYRLDVAERWSGSDYQRQEYCYLDERQSANDVSRTAALYYNESCDPERFRDGTINTKPWQLRYYEPQLTYHMRGNLCSAGVASEVVNRLSEWGERVYPVGNWSAYTCTGNPMPIPEGAPTPDPDPDPDPTPDPDPPAPADSTYDDTAVWSNIDEGDVRPTVVTTQERYPEPVNGICFYLNGSWNRCDPTGPNEGSQFHFYTDKDRYQMQRTDVVLAVWDDTDGNRWYTEAPINCVGEDCVSEPQPDPEPEPDNTIYVEVGQDTLRYTIGADEYGFYSVPQFVTDTVFVELPPVVIRDTVTVTLPPDTVIVELPGEIIRDTVTVVQVDTLYITRTVIQESGYAVFVNGVEQGRYPTPDEARTIAAGRALLDPDAQVDVRQIYRTIEN